MYCWCCWSACMLSDTAQDVVLVALLQSQEASSPYRILSCVMWDRARGHRRHHTANLAFQSPFSEQKPYTDFISYRLKPIIST